MTWERERDMQQSGSDVEKACRLTTLSMLRNGPDRPGLLLMLRELRESLTCQFQLRYYASIRPMSQIPGQFLLDVAFHVSALSERLSLSLTQSTAPDEAGW